MNFSSSETCYVFCDTDVEVVESHRDLGLIVSSNLSWTEHVSVRLAKAYNTFHQISRNCSVKIGVRARIHLYKSTVLSVICYASAYWFANRGDMRSLEALQKKTSKWIFPTVADYKERLLKLDLLLIPFYLQMLDILTLSKFCANMYDVDVSAFLSTVSGPLRKNRNIPHIQHPRSEVVHQEFCRTTRLTRK